MNFLDFFSPKKKIKAKSKLQISSIQIELPFQLRCKTTELVQNWNRGRETWPTMKNVDSQILVEGANHGAEKADGSASPADAGEDAGGGADSLHHNGDTRRLLFDRSGRPFSVGCVTTTTQWPEGNDRRLTPPSTSIGLPPPTPASPLPPPCFIVVVVATPPTPRPPPSIKLYLC